MINQLRRRCSQKTTCGIYLAAGQTARHKGHKLSSPRMTELLWCDIGPFQRRKLRQGVFYREMCNEFNGNFSHSLLKQLFIAALICLVCVLGLCVFSLDLFLLKICTRTHTQSSTHAAEHVQILKLWLRLGVNDANGQQANEHVIPVGRGLMSLDTDAYTVTTHPHIYTN